MNALNTYLMEPDLIELIESHGDTPLTPDQITELTGQLSGMGANELSLLNRSYMEYKLPGYCPALEVPENPISAIFPLLSVVIENPEGYETRSDFTKSRSIGNVDSAAEFNEKKRAIDDEWKAFMKIYTLTFDDLEDVLSFCGAVSGDVSSFISNWINDKDGDSEGSGDFIVNEETGTATANGYGPLKKFFIITYDFLNESMIKLNKYLDDEVILDEVPDSEYLKIVEANNNGEITVDDFNFTGSTSYTNHAVEVSLGIMGKASVCWGNIEATITPAVYLSTDTNFSSKASYNNGNGTCKTAGVDLFDAEIPLGKTPPVIIGPVLINLSLQAGFKLPIAMNAKGNISLGYRAAFCGIYGFAATVGVNYGVKTGFHKIRIGWFTIYVPYLVPYVDDYYSGDILNDTVYYVGPDETLVLPVEISGEASISITPTAYIDGRILFWEWLYFSAKAKAGEEFKFTTSVNPKEGQYIPVIKGTGTAAHVVGVDLSAGLSFCIPIINWRTKIDIPIWATTYREEWARWEAFTVGD